MVFDPLRRFLLWLTKVLSRRFKKKESPTKTPVNNKPAQAAKTPRTDLIETVSIVEATIKTPAAPEKKSTEIPVDKEVLIGKEKHSISKPNEKLKTDVVKDGERPEEAVSLIETQRKPGTLRAEIVVKAETYTKGANEQKKTETEGEEEKRWKHRKPYMKKSPTEGGRERNVSSGTEKRAIEVKQKREIDLGWMPRRPQRSAKGSSQLRKEKQTSKMQEKDILTRVLSPFIELDLYEAKIYLLLPGQEFTSGRKDASSSQNIEYELEINEKKQRVFSNYQHYDGVSPP